jgi:hypothetical protein
MMDGSPPTSFPLPQRPGCAGGTAASIDEALRLTREKRHDEALTLIARCRTKPEKTALLIKAHILLNRKEYAAAEEAAQRVLKIEAWSVDALVILGLAAKWRNQAADAVKWFKQAAYANHECWPAHYYLAELYRADNELDKARRAIASPNCSRTGAGGLAVIPPSCRRPRCPVRAPACQTRRARRCGKVGGMALDLKNSSRACRGGAIIARLGDGLDALERDPADRENVNTIFRSAHTIKGSSRMLKLAGITDTAHKLEDVLGAMREGSLSYSADLGRLLYRGVDPGGSGGAAGRRRKPPAPTRRCAARGRPARSGRGGRTRKTRR